MIPKKMMSAVCSTITPTSKTPFVVNISLLHEAQGDRHITPEDTRYAKKKSTRKWTKMALKNWLAHSMMLYHCGGEMMDINWEELERQIKEFRMAEKVEADINSKFGILVNDFTKEKFPEWQKKMGSIVRDMIESNKDDPEAAAEALILILPQMVHQIPRHEVLLEYVENYNAKMLQQLRAMDERTVSLIQVLVAKGVISERDFDAE
ncbi:MAG: hypothetical protein MPW16_21195 (plasmid) [Candidatus Manganitrophus sp.]|nr:MAG: hypothetical protein MPW16_21195 [Candidatus Manganitrophus sp.]